MGLPAPQPSQPPDIALQPSQTPDVELHYNASNDDIPNDEAATQAKEQGQIAQIHQDLQQDEPINEDEFLEDPETKTAKDKYRTDYLDEHQEELSKHLQDLIDGYPAKGSTEEQAQIAVAFEATVDYCIEKGKSSAETIMLSIIRGIAKGVIRYDHISYYQKYLKNAPILAYLFETHLKDQKAFQKLANRFKGGSGKKFQNFFWTEIMNNETVQKTTDQYVGENAMDHDHIGEMVPAGSLETCKKITNKNTVPTAIQNAYSGSIMKLEENVGHKTLPQNIGYFVLINGILSGAAYPENEEYARWKDEWMEQIPRIAPTTNHPNTNMGDLRIGIMTALQVLDDVFFRYITNADEENFQKIMKPHLKKKYNIKTESLNEVYDKLDKIIPAILKKTGWLKKWKFKRAIKKSMKK